MKFKLDLKNPWFRRAGLIVAVVPFIWIFFRPKFSTFPPHFDLHVLTAMLATIPKLAWWTIPQLVVSWIISTALQGTRWWLLLCAFSRKVPFLSALSYHFKSIYYSTVLPTSAGQEVLRALFVQKQTGAAVSWGAAWICKITALMFSLFFSIYGLFYISYSSLPKQVIYIVAALFAVLLGAGALSFSKRFTTPIRHLLSSIIPPALMKKVELIREGVYQYRHKKRQLLETIILTFPIQLLQVVTMALVIKGISGRMYFWECLAFIPLIELISVSQPLTPSGIGVRETLSALMLKHVGLSNEQAGIYIVILFSSNLLRLVGVIPVIFESIMQKKRAVPQSARL